MGWEVNSDCLGGKIRLRLPRLIACTCWLKHCSQHAIDFDRWLFNQSSSQSSVKVAKGYRYLHFEWAIQSGPTATGRLLWQAEREKYKTPICQKIPRKHSGSIKGGSSLSTSIRFSRHDIAIDISELSQHWRKKGSRHSSYIASYSYDDDIYTSHLTEGNISRWGIFRGGKWTTEHAQ